MSLIPTKLTDMNIYSEGHKMMGTNGEMDLPELEPIKTEVAGAGIAGSFEDPTPGYFAPLKVTIKFRTIDEDAVHLAAHEAHTLTLRAAQTKHNPADGTNTHEGIKVVFRGLTTKFAMGKAKSGEPTDTEIEKDVTYLKITKNGETMVELDKFNHVYIVGKKDYMKQIRDLI